MVNVKSSHKKRKKNGLTALMLASRRGRHDAVKALLGSRADVNLQHDFDGNTALMQALWGRAY